MWWVETPCTSKVVLAPGPVEVDGLGDLFSMSPPYQMGG
jgi:hypothetical protein